MAISWRLALWIIPIGLAIWIGLTLMDWQEQLRSGIAQRQEVAVTAIAIASAPTATIAPPTADYDLEQVDAMVQAGDLRGALLRLERISELHPNDVRIYLAWTKALIIWGNAPMALEKAQRATEIAPKSADALGLVCLAQDWNNRYEEALNFCEQALEIDPNNALAHASLAETLADLGRGAEALEAGEKAIELKPEDADAHRAYGYALEALARFRDAEKAYQRAVELQPGSLHYRITLARLHRRTGSEDKSLHELEQLADQFRLIPSHSTRSDWSTITPKGTTRQSPISKKRPNWIRTGPRPSSDSVGATI